MRASRLKLDTLAIISSRYQYGPFLFFCCRSYVKLLVYWRAEKNFLDFRRPPWGLRPVAFATSATWLIRHWCQNSEWSPNWGLVAYVLNSTLACSFYSRLSHAAKRDSSSQDAVCLSVCLSVCMCVCVCVCVEIFFPTNPYLQAGLTDLDEIWHDGRS